MGRLNEEFVRTEALVFLKEHYSQKHNFKLISEKKEATVKFRGKKGRADGVLTYLDARERIITVALEAKSRKTYASIKPVFADARLLVLLLSTLVLVFMLSMFAFDEMRLWIRIVVSAGIGVIASAAVAMWVVISYTDVKRGVISQLQRYPADYRWIALPVDAFNIYNNRKKNSYDDFLDHLRVKRMGLILVSGRNKSKIALEPRTRRSKINHKYYKRYPSLKNDGDSPVCSTITETRVPAASSSETRLDPSPPLSQPSQP